MVIKTTQSEGGWEEKGSQEDGSDSPNTTVDENTQCLRGAGPHSRLLLQPPPLPSTQQCFAYRSQH